MQHYHSKAHVAGLDKSADDMDHREDRESEHGRLKMKAHVAKVDVVV